MANHQQLKLDITAITKDLKQRSKLGSGIKTLGERDYSRPKPTAQPFSKVETEKKKQKNKETNVITHCFKKLSEHKVEEKMKDILSFSEIETDPMKIDSVGTTKEQNKKLLLIKLPSPQSKWKLIRSVKKLREDTGYDGIYINPDINPEQRKLGFETRNKLRELRQ